MLPKLYGKQEKVIEETIKVAVSYVKETVVKLFKLCKKAGFDKIRTPKSFTLHLKKKKKKKKIHSQNLSILVYKRSLNL